MEKGQFLISWDIEQMDPPHELIVGIRKIQKEKPHTELHFGYNFKNADLRIVATSSEDPVAIDFLGGSLNPVLGSIRTRANNRSPGRQRSLFREPANLKLVG